MKSLISLWKCILDETGMWCRTSTTRDLETATRRVAHEGESFLTITLPDFGKEFQKALDQGKVAPNMFLSFKRHKGLPRFLGGYLELVFDRDTGVLLENPSIDAIRSVRQLTLMFGKIKRQCSDKRNADAIKGYLQCEKDLRGFDQRINGDALNEYRYASSVLLDRVFFRMDRQIHRGELLPKHGPGSTADRRRGNDKFRPSLWTRRLENVFPMDSYLIPNHRYWQDIQVVKVLEPGQEIPVKVTLVPKTLKTPRIIAQEPTHMQYMQQGLLDLFLREYKKDDKLSSLLGFDDQTPNQRMALKGSRDGSLATLDLSEASDRVSNQLVRTMSKSHPHLFEALDATRSRRADVPGHGVIRLSKFASMGSAMCFPVEAMVFVTLVFMGIARQLSTSVTPKLVNQYWREVRIFGDDIVVPTEFAESVRSVLHEFAFKVNADKSYWTGKFRESCGKEYYDGEDVSIIRCRNDFPKDSRDAEKLASLVAMRNQLYRAGYWATCARLDKHLKALLGAYPAVSETSEVLGRHTFLPITGKMCKNLHHPLVKGYVLRSKPPKSNLDGSGALLKFFLKRGDLPVHDVKHLERSGRPKRVDTKLGWHKA